MNIQKSPAASNHRKEIPPATAERSRLLTSFVALSAASGVLIIAAAYTAGRLGHSSSAWADHLYWAGQVLILIPIAIRLFSRRTLTESDSVVVIIVLAISEYLTKICYSPAGFTFSDELSHWRTAENILQTGKLFTVNYSLIVSPQYPGLEETTSALVSITGLPVFACGLIVAGVAHLMFVCTLYMLLRYISGSYRFAGIAILIYSSNPDFASFDSMFIYQTLALAFLGLFLLAVWHLNQMETLRQHVSWLVVAILMIADTVVTHHITSYVLVVVLILLALGSLISGDRRLAAWSSILALWSAVAVLAWVAFVARQTTTFFQPVMTEVSQSLHALFASGHSGARPSSVVDPRGNRLLAAVAVLLVSILLPFGWWQVWRRYRHQPWAVALAIGSFSWYAVVVIRLKVADGSELAGRAATFVFVPVAFIAVLALNYVFGLAIRRWTTACTVVSIVSIVGIVIVALDGAVNGWPPYWERLPGPYQVGGVERSVDPEGIAVAKWTLARLGGGNRFAVDYGNWPLISTYGDQQPVFNVSLLYTSQTYTQSDAEEVQSLSVNYILVDLRLSQSLPASGQYFFIDPNAGEYTHPIPRADLTKFDHVRGVARILDTGKIVIYKFDGNADAP